MAGPLPVGCKQCEPAPADRKCGAFDSKLVRNEVEPAAFSQSQSIRAGDRVNCEPKRFALQADTHSLGARFSDPVEVVGYAN
jgi:hypothetical protein